MCGIAGLLSRDPLTLEDVSAVAAMGTALTHRGPDGSGHFSDRHIALNMRRLSIIDPLGAQQPLYNENRSLVLIANGEIYNYVELRAGLVARGHTFSTRGDCEPLLHLYEEQGLAFVRELRGMFAFALWDVSQRRLILGRDRMGEKPLYLFEQGDTILFASELKSLLSSQRVPFDLDPVSIDLFFHYHYVPDPRTPLKGVRKLPAASLLVIDAASWDVSESTYWRMEDAPPLESEPGEAIREQLEEVSALTIRADVPVGVALSGGLDSSIVAALAARQNSEIHAFSVGYPGRPRVDERSAAHALADHVGIDFHEIEIPTSDVVRGFPDLVHWQDDPIADIAGFGYRSVAMLARDHGIPVLLQGHGGDELFWGYPWLAQAVEESERKNRLIQDGWRAYPSYLRLQPLDHFGPRSMWRWGREMFGLRSGAKELRRHLASPPNRLVFYDLLPGFGSVRAGYTDEFTGALADAEAGAHFTYDRPWPRLDTKITELICSTYLRENGIAQADRLGMASSVELRLPLVDHRLIETVIGLRRHASDHRLSPKARLRAATRDLIPPDVLDRPKRGFEPPVGDWFAGVFAAHRHHLDDGFLATANLLAPEVLAAEPSSATARRGWTPQQLFAVLVLELWCRSLGSIVGTRA